jgi:hypothetical protein
MKISKLEIERFINVFIDYRATNDTTMWFNNRNYLQDNDLGIICDVIETLVNHDYDTLEDIIKVIEALREVEVC